MESSSSLQSNLSPKLSKKRILKHTAEKKSLSWPNLQNMLLFLRVRVKVRRIEAHHSHSTIVEPILSALVMVISWKKFKSTTHIYAFAFVSITFL